MGALQAEHECLGIGFKKLYPSWLFSGKGETEKSPMPVSGAEAQALLHYGVPATWRKALKEIQDFHPAGVVLTWWVSFWALHLGWLARKLSADYPVVFLCHNVLPHEARAYDPLITRWTLRSGRGFLVHSEDDRRKLLEWFPQARVIRREHPVYHSTVGDAISREKARKRLGITGRMILFFGFVRPYKGLDIAIEAVSRLPDDLEDLTLWVSGEFWEDVNRYQRLIDRYQLRKRIHIESGYISDEELALRLTACDAVILPYRSVTGSGVLANAFALDRPVIATKTGCFKEMVTHGENGILCEPENADSLSAAIREFYRYPGPDRFTEGVIKAKEQFTWEAIVKAIGELITDG